LECKIDKGIFRDRIDGKMGILVVNLVYFFVIFIFAEVKKI